MVPPDKSSLDGLAARLEDRTRRAKKQALLFSSIPVAVAVALIVATSLIVRHASHAVQNLQMDAVHYSETIENLKKEKSRYDERIDALKSQYDSEKKQLEDQNRTLRTTLQAAERRIQQATDFDRFLHPIDMVDLKSLSSRYPRQAEMLKFILDLRQRNVRWRLGGRSPDEGFDSPGFAAYVLRQTGPESLRDLTQTPASDIGRLLLDRMPQDPQPRIGDLAFYPSGYVLFYFLDRSDRPFVIGMTPFGIAALEPGFATIVGFRRTIL